MSLQCKNKQIFQNLYNNSKEVIKDYNFYVVYNLKVEKDDQKDFFSYEELDYIKKLAHDSKGKFIFIEDEKEFVRKVEKMNPDTDIVINLTRRGTTNNKKLLVTSLCDIYGIQSVSSSGYTVNLCRNKIHFSVLLPEELKTTLKTYYYNINNYSNMLDAFNNKQVIIKSLQSAGSLNLNEDSKFIFTKSHEVINNNNNYVIQEYIEGTEIEVPFFIVDNAVHILGFFEIIVPRGHTFLTEDISDSFDYTIKQASVTDLQKEEIIQTICAGVREFYIEYYGRFDFIVKNNTVKLFDVATSPFFTENTSFNIGMECYSHTVLDILTYIAITERFPKIDNQ